jgi:hypothetical protein
VSDDSDIDAQIAALQQRRDELEASVDAVYTPQFRAQQLGRAAAYFYEIAAPDLPGVTLEQFIALTDPMAEPLLGLPPGSVPEAWRVLPDLTGINDRKISRDRRAAKAVVPGRLRHSRTRELISVSYKRADRDGLDLVGVLGVEGTAPSGDDLLDGLAAAGLSPEVVDLKASGSGDRPMVVFALESRVLRFELGDAWLDWMIGDKAPMFRGEIWTGGLPDFLGDLANDYLLLDFFPNPGRRLAPVIESLEGRDLRELAVSALKGFAGAHLALLWLSTESALDIWFVKGNNRGLQQRVIEYEDATLQRIKEMAEVEPSAAEVVSSVIEQIQRVSDPLARIALGDELSRSLAPAVTEQMMADAADFRDGGGTWKQIGERLGISASGAQKKLVLEERQRNNERARRRYREG